MRRKSFRFCMLVGAIALGAVALFYFVNYAVVLSIALGNSGIQPALQASIRAMWLAFACQGLLIGLLYAVVAFRPRAVSREVIVLFGLLQLVEAALLFSFSGSVWMALLLSAAALCVLAGAVLWPQPVLLGVPTAAGLQTVAGAPAMAGVPTMAGSPTAAAPSTTGAAPRQMP